MDDEEDGDQARDGAEQRHAEQHKTEIGKFTSSHYFCVLKLSPKSKVVLRQTGRVVSAGVAPGGAGQADVQRGVGGGPGLERVRIRDLTRVGLTLYFVFRMSKK